MQIQTDLAIKVFFPKSTFVQVYFEAIANAFDANATEIDISIEFVEAGETQDLIITITDNGDGFTDDRFERFAKIKEPTDVYHKGVGRLVFLRYFDLVDVTSVFNGTRRRFLFRKEFDGTSEVAPTDSTPTRTQLIFKHFSNVRLKTLETVTPLDLKDKVITQFLPLLWEKKRSGKIFKISIMLNTPKKSKQKALFPDIQTITFDDIPEFNCHTIADKRVDGFDSINLHYMIKHDPGNCPPLTAICIDGRTIPISLLAQGAMPLDKTGIFLFESKLFSGISDSSRQEIIFPENVSKAAIIEIMRNELSAILIRAVPEIEKKNTDTKLQFEEKFPHLVGYFDELALGLIDKADAIRTAQDRFFKDQRDVLESVEVDDRTYQKSLEAVSKPIYENHDDAQLHE